MLRTADIVFLQMLEIEGPDQCPETSQVLGLKILHLEGFAEFSEPVRVEGF